MPAGYDRTGGIGRRATGSARAGDLGGWAKMEMHQIRYFMAVCNTLNFTGRRRSAT